MSRPITAIPTTRPWWREPMLWLVVGGPALVVVAGVATAVLALRGADVPLDTRAGMPAVQGRNHAAAPPTVEPAPQGTAGLSRASR